MPIGLPRRAAWVVGFDEALANDPDRQGLSLQESSSHVHALAGCRLVPGATHLGVINSLVTAGQPFFGDIPEGIDRAASEVTKEVNATVNRQKVLVLTMTNGFTLDVTRSSPILPVALGRRAGSAVGENTMTDPQQSIAIAKSDHIVNSASDLSTLLAPILAKIGFCGGSPFARRRCLAERRPSPTSLVLQFTPGHDRPRERSVPSRIALP